MDTVILQPCKNLYVSHKSPKMSGNRSVPLTIAKLQKLATLAQNYAPASWLPTAELFGCCFVKEIKLSSDANLLESIDLEGALSNRALHAKVEKNSVLESCEIAFQGQLDAKLLKHINL